MIDYKFRLKQINKWVDLSGINKKNLSTKDKSFISKHFNILFGSKKKITGENRYIHKPGLLVGKEFQRKAPRNKERLKQLLKWENIKGTKHLKAVPVRAIEGRKTIIKWKGNKIVSVSDSTVTRIVEKFNKKNFLKSPEAEIKRIMDKHPNIKSWALMTGDHVSKTNKTRSEIKDYILNSWEGSGIQIDHFTGMMGQIFKSKKASSKYLTQSAKAKERLLKEAQRIKKLDKKKGKNK